MKAFECLERNLPLADLAAERAAFVSVVAQLRALMTTVEPYVRPTRSRAAHPFVQREFPEIRRDKFEPGVVLDRTDFAKAAQSRPSPFAAADAQASEQLPSDLVLAIERLLERREGIKADREQRLDVLRALAARLEPMRAKLDASKSEAAKLIAAPFNAAWTAAVIDAIEWPDVELPLLYVRGFASIFDVPDSGVFREDLQPAEIAPADFKAANTRMVAQISDEIERSALHGDAEQRERRAHCWRRTREEIAAGLIKGPYSRARMDRKYKRGRWRCIGRNAIKQKGKWRCIDNGKRTKHNKATRMHERITCGRADFPLMVSREFARRGVQRGITKRAWRKQRMRHGTNDLKSAYRHVPTRDPDYTCVAVWSTDAQKVVYCDVPGHNFGLKSAVVNFNRFPELAAVAARRLLWVVTEHYYDDNDTCEPGWAGDSGQLALIALCGCDFFGFPFDPDQHVPMHTSNEYLGVESRLHRMHEGVLEMDVSTKRREKLHELIEETQRSGELRSGLASSIFGKAGFMLSPCYGCVGRACLQPIMQREHQRSRRDITNEIQESLDFIKLVCEKLPALEVPLLPDASEPVVTFTDASGKKRRGPRPPSGHVGFVVYHPVYGTVYAHKKVPMELVKLLDGIKQRDTYIGQFELIAAITPFVSLPPEWLHGRPVELWIDNSMAIGSLLRGYSGVPDCARIVNMFHFAIAKLGLASLWIDYVPSESNPADIPSRFDEMSESQAASELAELGDPMQMVLPDFADADGAWLSPVDIAASVWAM